MRQAVTFSALESLGTDLGLGLPRLLGAREQTSQRLAVRRDLLANAGLPEDVAVIFVGSWGRREVTDESDNDFYLLSDHPPADSAGLVAHVTEVLRQEEADFRGPGREDVFGQDVVSLQSLIENVGLDRDTNTNLTQRMLLVLESVAAYNDDLHAAARRDVITTYLEDPIKDCQPPRLFLNDVVRYWRTMCVDFAGKMMDREGQGWGLRNAKLRTTRKMLFASGLLPLLQCGRLTSEEIAPFLHEQFAWPPTDRVAHAFTVLDRQAAGGRVFGAYEAFFEHLRSGETRQALDALKSRPEADRSDLFQSIAELGGHIEAGLLELLFDTSLNETTRRYGIF